MTDQIDQASLSFKFDVKLILLFISLFPILVWLGFWQLERAEEKHQLQQEFSLAKKKPAVNWNANDLENYRLISASGYLDSQRYWLLDNQVKRGKVGFDVIMPLRMDNQTLFVNRGWVAGDLSRTTLPVFDTPDRKVTLVGRVYLPQQQKYYKSSDGWPKIIGSSHLQSMSEALAVKNPQGLLRLQADSPGALVTAWPEINISVAKHQGYAVQWFAMAFALLVLFTGSSSNILAVIKINIIKSK